MAINRGTLEKIRFDLTADTLNVLAINSIGSFVHKHLVPYNLSGMTPAGTNLPLLTTYRECRLYQLFSHITYYYV